MLRVELDTELGDQIELGLEEIDVLFLVVHELLEEIRSVYIENPDESARAIEVALRARLAKLELRFEAAKKGGVS
jgi:hypothetical protein